MKLGARELYDMMLVIADVISAHCPGTTARERFFRASLTEDWEEVRCLIDGMLAEPWHLRGNQEQRLQEFLDLVPVGSSSRTVALSPPRNGRTVPSCWRVVGETIADGVGA
jgi:hypothetical protein